MLCAKSPKFLLIFNLTVAALAFGAWVRMLFFGEAEALSSVGLRSLRYYTVLSNLFEGAISLIFALAIFRAAKNRERSVGKWIYILKLMAAGTVGVTFMVVILFLGPLYGYGNMYQGANFWFHLIVPLMAASEFIFLDHFGKIPFRFAALSLCPTVIYGVVYLLNLLLNGTEGNDFYGFALWGIGVGAIIFAMILLLNLAIVLILSFLNNRTFLKYSKIFEK